MNYIVKVAVILLNLFGAMMGLAAYSPQMMQTNPILWILVIDCPLAAIFFVILLLGFDNPYFDALARTTAFKYGLWTIVVTFSAPDILSYELSGLNMILHTGLILEAFMFVKQKLLLKHFIPAAIFLFLNDFSDYLLLTHPPINNSLFLETGIYTVLSSIVTLIIFISIYKNIKISSKRTISS